MSRRTRVIHFGIDGGSFEVLDRLAGRGLMPEYGRVQGDGGCAVLRSTTPWFTVPGWITWMTGVPAERHGRIYWTATSSKDFWERKGGNRHLVTTSDVGYPTVFRILSDAGVSVASVNMPVTFPPSPVNGVMISGFGAPPDLERAAYPSGFLRRYPEYRIDAETSLSSVLGQGRAPGYQDLTDEEVAAYVVDLTSMAKARHQVVMDLIREGHDFVSVVYVGSDRLSHVAWPQLEAVLRGENGMVAHRAVESYYRTLDRLLAETRRAAPDALFLVTSDHGQGPSPDRRIAPNVWLNERMWLTIRSPQVRRAVRRLPGGKIRRRLWEVWRRTRNIPVGASPHVDWNATLAYAMPMAHCRVFGVAVKGGEGLQEEVASGLLELVDRDSGLKPIERVVFSDDVCRDGARALYPDLLAFLRPEYGATNKVEGEMFHPAPAGHSGYHEPEGVLLATGPDVASGWHEETSIADIAPTLLAAFGVASAPQMEGSPVAWVVPPSDDLRRPGDPKPHDAGIGLTAKDEDLIHQHLQGLGYVE